MFKVMVEEINAIFGAQTILIWTYVWLFFVVPYVGILPVIVDFQWMFINEPRRVISKNVAFWQV